MASNCLQITENGNPPDVIHVAPHQHPPHGPHDVLIRMAYAPVNPADLNVIQGNYGRKPALPCIPGHEGSGIVEKIGPEVTSLQPGDHVIPLLGAGTWTQHMQAAEYHFAKIPAQMDLKQAAMLRVNPVTAWLILHEYHHLEPGDWVAQNAANSAVGRSLIQIAAKKELRTLNFVRRPDLIPELQALGATHVFLDSPEGHAQAKATLGGDPLLLAANTVSGDSAIRLMDLLSPQGSLITYGAMARTALKVPNSLLIFKSLQLHGLWVTRWLEQANSGSLYEVLEPLTELMLHGQLTLAIQDIIPFQQAAKALTLAAEPGRSGKILLDFTQTS
jgi:trans-2-enoyl-CoA reductase